MSNEKETGRITPQNLEAEKSLLGAILISEEVLSDIVELVSPNDFYDEKHRTIATAIWKLYERRSSIDLITVRNELKSKKLLEKAGGSAFLTELSNYTPTAAHSVDYAKIIHEKAIRRRLISAAAKITEEAYNENGDAEAVMGEAEKVLFDASDKNVKTDATPLADLLSSTFDKLEQLHENKGSIAGLKTGYPDLDRVTAGFHRSDLIILAARPAMGKTALALNFARNVATINKKAVLIFSLEMSQDQLAQRMLSDASGVNSFNISTGNLTDEDFARISDGMSELSEDQIFIDDKPGMNVMEMRTKARRVAHKHELGLIVVDYLQLMSGSSSRGSDNRVQEVSEISRGLKLIARELNVPVIALSQLNRGVDNRDSKIPVLSDLRESGSIEQDADIVMFIHREDYYDKETDRQNIADLVIAKHRRGATKNIELYFDKEHVRFMSLDTKHD